MTRARAMAGLCALALGAASAPALAAPADSRDAKDPGPSETARLQAEIDRLKQELATQRELIFKLMQAEQQRYDVLLKFLQAGGASGGAEHDGDPGRVPKPPRDGSRRAEPGGAPRDPSSLLPPLPAPSPTSASKSGGAPAGSDSGKESAAGGRETATVSGRIKSSAGQPIGEAYVYVDGLRSTARNHIVEIKQRDKQFAPRVTVVPLGTKLLFPNQDTVIHNVFSTAPGNSFDLGSVKGGETSPPVVLLKPGPVEIFCNIHSKMRADVLVVPNSHWTRVGADGAFQIAGVPVGTRKIVLWSPTLKSVSQQVEVTSKGGNVTFSSEAMTVRPHLNKRGQAYGSYDE